MIVRGVLSMSSDYVRVILLSEPGCPHPTETYKGRNKLKQTCEYTFKAIERGTDRFHQRLKN